MCFPPGRSAEQGCQRAGHRGARKNDTGLEKHRRLLKSPQGPQSGQRLKSGRTETSCSAAEVKVMGEVWAQEEGRLHTVSRVYLAFTLPGPHQGQGQAGTCLLPKPSSSPSLSRSHSQGLLDTTTSTRELKMPTQTDRHTHARTHAGAVNPKDLPQALAALELGCAGNR